MPRSSLIRPYMQLLNDLRLQELASGPSTLAGYSKLWAKNDQTLWVRDSAGGDTQLGSGIVVPTQANTGLSSWVNQDTASLTEGDFGMSINWTGIGSGLNMLVKSSPATPYTIVSKISTTGVLTLNSAVAVGWRDSSTGKINIVIYDLSNQIRVGYASDSVFTGWWSDVIQANARPSIWYAKLEDDGTNVAWSISNDGVGWWRLYTTTKAGGYLGATGYNQVLWGGANLSANYGSAGLLYWEES